MCLLPVASADTVGEDVRVDSMEFLKAAIMAILPDSCKYYVKCRDEPCRTYFESYRFRRSAEQRTGLNFG